MQARLIATCAAIALLFASPVPAAIQIDFEELSLFTGANPAGGGSFYNGNNGSGASNSNGWSSQGAFFNNSYTGDFLPAFDFWDGWGYSNVVNPSTAGVNNQYAAFPGGGANGSGGVAAGGMYAIVFGSGAYFNVPLDRQLLTLDITNTTYTALTLRDGDMFSKKFGGASGNDPDLYRVTLTGYEALGASGNAVGSIDVALADYRFADNSLDYILNQWLTVDVSALAGARSIGLNFFSTDVGSFGINTPTYAAIDNITFSVVPETNAFLLCSLLATVALFARQRYAS